MTYSEKRQWLLKSHWNEIISTLIFIRTYDNSLFNMQRLFNQACEKQYSYADKKNVLISPRLKTSPYNRYAARKMRSIVITIKNDTEQKPKQKFHFHNCLEFSEHFSFISQCKIQKVNKPKVKFSVYAYIEEKIYWFYLQVNLLKVIYSY